MSDRSSPIRRNPDYNRQQVMKQVTKDAHTYGIGYVKVILDRRDGEIYFERVDPKTLDRKATQ